MVRLGAFCGALLALAFASSALAQDADTVADPSHTPKAPPGVARLYETEFRTDTFSLPLSQAGEVGAELEYFVRMKNGAALVYSWSVEGEPPADEFYSDFHGVTSMTPPMEVVSYREGVGLAANGSLIAPFDGVHGWLFKNDSLKPVTVKLTIAGFYELRSVRETMGIEGGGDYLPFGPADWKDRYGPSSKPKD